MIEKFPLPVKTRLDRMPDKDAPGTFPAMP
jgi:hypothetical protein